MSALNDTSTFDEDFEMAAMTDLDAIKAALLQQGIEHPSNTCIKALVRNVQSKKCNCCYFVGDNLQILKSHLKEKKHTYGQRKYAMEKRDLIKRIKTRVGDSTLPDVDNSSTEHLSTDERSAFSSFASDERLTSAEKSSYNNLLYIGFCSVHLRGKIDVPSPATERKAKNALNAARAASSTAAARNSTTPADSTGAADTDEVNDIPLANLNI